MRIDVATKTIGAIAGLILLSGAAAQAATPVGVWLSDDGGTKVKISNCSGKLCGTVVALNEPIDHETGKAKTDKHNPNPAQRARPLLGLTVVKGLTPSGPDRWSGEIYNADDGRIYQASLTVESTNSARVQGCVLRILCKSHQWTRSD
jgi:uncharacterized protein (DUF2147 family)